MTKNKSDNQLTKRKLTTFLVKKTNSGGNFINYLIQNIMQ